MRFADILMTAASQGSGGFVFANAEASALVARMTTTPDATRKALIDNMIGALKTAGVWTKLDILYVPAAADSQAARLNWTSSSFTLSAVNSPTFTTDRGYAGDGSTSYLDTGWVPSVNGVNHALNSGCLGVYLNAGTNTAATVSAMGASSTGTASSVIPYAAAGHIGGRINAAASAASTGPAASRLGFTAISRTDAANHSLYRNAALDSTVASASASLPTVSVFLCGIQSVSGTLTTPLNNQIAAAFAGAGLTTGELLAFQQALLTYLTAAGAN